jgi:hypothetical protein
MLRNLRAIARQAALGFNKRKNCFFAGDDCKEIRRDFCHRFAGDGSVPTRKVD